MKVNAYATTLHRLLLDRMRASLPDGFNSVTMLDGCGEEEVMVKRPGFLKMSIQKVLFWHEQIHDPGNDGEAIILSDVDVQLFPTATPHMYEEALADQDIVFQTSRQGWQGNELCAGFQVVRCNDRSREFYNRILQRMNWASTLDSDNARSSDEQDAIIYLADSCQCAANWCTMPEELMFGPDKWIDDMPTAIQVPKVIHGHHATHVRGIENKLIQLDHVQRKVLENNDES